MAIERKLSKTQSRVVIALVDQRQRILDEANSQIEEVNAALDEQAEHYRQGFDLPEGEYRFNGDKDGIKLVMVEKPKVEDAELAEHLRDEAADLDETAAGIEEGDAVSEDSE